jgi:hypothetical protein
MPWDEGLSPEQATAASAPGPHTLPLSGPGTGKTRTITNRVAFLEQELSVSSEDILVLTFGRSAARELRQRLTEMGIPVPMVSTLHAFSLRQLLLNGAAPELPSPILIADDLDERQVIEEDLKTLLDRPVRVVRKALRDLASDWETLNADTDDWETSHPDPRFLGALRQHRMIYGYTLRSELVYRVKRAFQERPDFEIEREFAHVIVDEYQDINRCELAVVQALADRGASLFVAGDDDQCIYSFRHAFPRGIREFATTYPDADEEELEGCHRCAREILRVARSVAMQDVEAEPKNLRPRDDAPEGTVEVLGFRTGAPIRRLWRLGCSIIAVCCCSVLLGACTAKAPQGDPPRSDNESIEEQAIQPLSDVRNTLSMNIDPGVVAAAFFGNFEIRDDLRIIGVKALETSPNIEVLQLRTNYYITPKGTPIAPLGLICTRWPPRGFGPSFMPGGVRFNDGDSISFSIFARSHSQEETFVQGLEITYEANGETRRFSDSRIRLIILARNDPKTSRTAHCDPDKPFGWLRELDAHEAKLMMGPQARQNKSN